MRIALLADIHANALALEAALAAVKTHRPDRIISLGDQVNLGPCPKETLAMLREHGVTCLSGNHERYILSAIAGDREYAGANFESLRFNAGLLAPEEITFPETMTVRQVTFCHAMPGDDRFPVHQPRAALPRLKKMAFHEPTHIVCGHGHNPTHYRVGNLTLDSIGSVGCMDEGVPGTTSFTILDLHDGAAVLRPYSVPYDARGLRAMFRRSGMADYCPVMARLNLTQMELNRGFLVDFVTRALKIAQERGEEAVSRETWLLADSQYPWPDGLSTAAFWREGQG